jgi:pimeloyl-ACP methyl ester carboxylesterase
MNTRSRFGVLLTLVVVAAAGSGCGTNVASPTPRAQSIRLTSASGQAELLLEPPKVHGIVLFMHGIDSNQNELLDDTGLFPIRDALLAAHYAIATSDAHGNNLGNPASVSDQVELLADVTTQLDARLPVDILAFSMGGADALLSAAQGNITGLRSVALLSPLCDQLPFLDGAYRGAVQTAFGDPSDATLETVVARSDPLKRPATDYAGKAYGFWQSPTDQIVPASQSRQMVAYLHQAGVQATLTKLNGNHGDLSELNPADVVKMFGTVALSTTASSTNEEN